MGSFSFTCAVSGLTISAGDPVRFLLLTGSPYKNRSHGRCNFWLPRVYPLRGKYNDYGSVEDVEDTVLRQSWLDLFKLDLIEVGVGDNTIHDVAAFTDWTFEEMLEALWQGRIQVGRHRRALETEMLEFDQPEHFKKFLAKIKAEAADEPEVIAVADQLAAARTGAAPTAIEDDRDPRLPTLRNMTKHLTDAGLRVATGGCKDGASYFVDEECHGSVRVRWAGYGNAKEHHLEQAAVALAGRFATMVTCGSGSYADEAELLVRPYPARGGAHISIPNDHASDKKNEMSVAMAMIREDVWQALAQIPVTPGYDGTVVTLDDAKVAVRERLTQVPLHRYDQRERDWKAGGAALLFSDHEALGVAVDTSIHWNLMSKRFRAGELSEAEAEAFVSTVAEFVMVSRTLAMTRYWWRPSSSEGPQCGERELEARVTQAYADIAKNIVARYDDDSDDD